jgi:dGTPase
MTIGAEARYERRSGFGQAGDGRTEPRRDRDRLLYSPYLRRLSGITQIISPHGYHPTHNRLTHTLEVAQISRSIAERLLTDAERDTETIELFGGLDPDIVEAAALAHDVGHPPFGHIAERELDNLLLDKGQGSDGYEGNAQTFRILSKLDVRFDDIAGLDLTRATLSAVSKYPWFREESGTRHRKWGAYSSETDEFQWSRAHLTGDRKNVKTLEAEIMDWSDDIAYAVHDLEDFYRAGLVPLDRLIADGDERRRFFEAAALDDPDRAETALLRLLRFAPVEDPFDGSHKSRARLKQLSSSLVDLYITSTSVEEPSVGADCLAIHEDRRYEVELLKRVTWIYVIDGDAVRSQRYGQRTVIRRLFHELLSDTMARSKGSRLLPTFYRDLITSNDSESNMARCVADFISSLTEPQAIAFHNRITGTSLGTDLEQVVY